MKQTTKYRPASEFFKGHGNLACYLDARGLKGELSNYSVYWAEIHSLIDWKTERAKAESRILQREFPQYRGERELSPQVKQMVEQRVDAELNQLETERLEVIVPEMAQKFRKHLEWLDLWESVSFMVNVNLNDVDLGLRLASVFSQKQGAP